MKVQIDSIKQLKTEIQKKKAEIGGYEAQPGKLTVATAAQTPPDKKIVKAVDDAGSIISGTPGAHA